MITHKQARFEVGLCISAYDMNERLNAEQELYKYITQQEKKDKLLEYQNHYVNSIVIELERVINKIKLSQSEIIEKELEALK